MKNKIGVAIRILSILLFIVFITPHLAQINEVLLTIIIIVLLLINIAQLLSPMNLKRNLILYFGLILYFVFAVLWSKDYGFNKEFEYKGTKLNYKYSLFNGSYLRLFGDKSYNYNNWNNDSRKQKAIDYFVFMQCDIYEREQSYTEKQREDIKNGRIAIYNNYKYTKGDLKDFIVNQVNQNKVYLENYNYITKKKNIDLDTILKYKYQIFNINVEE